MMYKENDEFGIYFTHYYAGFATLTTPYLYSGGNSFYFYKKIYLEPIGEILSFFINLNFKDFNDFYHFIRLYGISGFICLSKTAKQSEYLKIETEEEFHFHIKKIWEESLPELLKMQKEFIDVVEFCFLNNDERFRGCTPIQKYYVFPKYVSDSHFECAKELIVEFVPVATSGDPNIDYNLTIEEKVNKIKNFDVDIQLSYDSLNIGAICYATLMEILKRKMIIKKCAIKSCNSYFIPEGRVDTLYCDSCQRAGGARLAYKEKVENNKLLQIYNREYQRRYAKLRNYDKAMKKVKLAELKKGWVRLAKEKMEETGLTIEDFEKWIDEQKSII